MKVNQIEDQELQSK